MRLIDADALKMAFKEDGHLSAYIEEYIDDAPAVDAVPVVHAGWEWGQSGWYCTACGKRSLVEAVAFAKYCPRCGAKMDGGAER